jgi:hypothetical protein
VLEGKCDDIADLMAGKLVEEIEIKKIWFE